jgi:hypothetical protein
MSSDSAAGSAATRSALNEFLDSASRSGQLGLPSLHGHRSRSDQFEVERRDLPFLIDQVLTAFHGSERDAAKLRHELNCVTADVIRMIEWAVPAHAELERLESFIYTAGCTPDDAQNYYRAKDQAFTDAARLQLRIIKSCNRARARAQAVCEAADRAAEQPGGSTGNQGGAAGGRDTTVGGEGGARETSAADPGGDEISEPELSARQRSILETMLAKEITSERRRKSHEHIVSEINRTHKASSYSRDFAALARSGLLRTFEGRNGGSWLSRDGIRVAQHLRNGA